VIHKPEAQAKVILGFEKAFACASGLSIPAEPGLNEPSFPRASACVAGPNSAIIVFLERAGSSSAATRPPAALAVVPMDAAPVLAAP
jgi:hypothetical protein